MVHQQKLSVGQLRARTQHKSRKKPATRKGGEKRVYGHQRFSRDIVSMRNHLEQLQLDPKLPAEKGQALSKQIGTLVKILQKVQKQLSGS